MKKRMTVMAGVLVSSVLAAAYADLNICQYPCSPPCNSNWGTTTYQCPQSVPNPGAYTSSVTYSQGQDANQCCLIAYTQQGNTGCQNDGPQITCQYNEVITYCDGSTLTIPFNVLFQPQTPGGGSSC